MTNPEKAKEYDIVREGDGDSRHGRYSTYMYHFCRCPECRQANADYNRDLRARRRAARQAGA